MLASTSSDTTALLWDVANLPTSGAVAPLRAEERAACWKDLARPAQRAFTAIWKLATDKDAVGFIREDLPPAASAPADKKVRQLIGELASEKFAVRSQATKQLTKFGPAIEMALRSALVPGLSLETRRRVEELLQAIATQHLRNGRALEVLEATNTSAARRLLQTLAAGHPEARLTREARASLERLRRRPPAKQL